MPGPSGPVRVMAAKKKKTAKKAAKKTARKAAKKSSGRFDVLNNGPGFSLDVQEGMEKILSRRKSRSVDFVSQSQLRHDLMPVPGFYMRWALDLWGLEKQSVLEIIGKDGIGKTSFIYSLFGEFMRAGSPCCVIVGENKPLKRSWAARCLSTDPFTAVRMCDALHVIRASTLDEMHELLETWLQVVRDPKGAAYVPNEVPLVVAVDPWGKIPTKAEAAGVSTYDGLDGVKGKGIGEGSNLDRSRWNAEWSRKLTVLQKRYNFLLIISNHQNVKIDMSGGSLPSFIPKVTQDLTNRTKPGGEATNQIASVQIVFVGYGNYKCRDEVVAKKIRARVYKNSYGEDGREFYFAIRKGDAGDGDLDYLVPGIDHWLPLPVWFAENRFFGVTEVKKRYSSSKLGMTALDLLEAAEHIRTHPDIEGLFSELGRRLKIEGYVDTYEKIVEKMKGEKNA